MRQERSCAAKEAPVKSSKMFLRTIQILLPDQYVVSGIPQPVWAAAFGLAQPLCVAGLPYSSSGISNRFEYVTLLT